jgi:uncharacterized YccA/Bax inhibitor family protein
MQIKVGCGEGDDGCNFRREIVPLWLKLLITLAAMVLTSLLAGMVWHWLFSTALPGYLSGAAGGISAVMTWEFLRKKADSSHDPGAAG